MFIQYSLVSQTSMKNNSKSKFFVGVKLLKSVYFPKCDFLRTKLKQNSPRAWKNIPKDKNFLMKGIKWKVGKWTNINIYKDPWIQTLPNFKLETQKREACIGYQDHSTNTQPSNLRSCCHHGDHLNLSLAVEEPNSKGWYGKGLRYIKFKWLLMGPLTIGKYFDTIGKRRNHENHIINQ